LNGKAGLRPGYRRAVDEQIYAVTSGREGKINWFDVEPNTVVVDVIFGCKFLLDKQGVTQIPLRTEGCGSEYVGGGGDHINLFSVSRK